MLRVSEFGMDWRDSVGCWVENKDELTARVSTSVCRLNGFPQWNSHYKEKDETCFLVWVKGFHVLHSTYTALQGTKSYQEKVLEQEYHAEWVMFKLFFLP